MFIKFVITLTFATFCSAAAAKDFYVSPSGSDKLNGLSPSVNFWTKTGPFKTLTRARNAIRQLKATGKFDEAITVHVGKGTYQLQSALELDDRDSGLPGQEITWLGEKGTSVLSGGIVLNGCQKFDPTNPTQIINCPVNNSIISSIMPENIGRMDEVTTRFEVFIDEHRMHPARWPDKDWAHIKKPLDENTNFSVIEAIPNFTGDLSNTQVHIFAGSDHFDEYIGVTNINPINNIIKLSNETEQKLASGRRFYLQNFQSGLNVSEEWYYDKQNSRIQLIPPLGTNPKQIVISTTTNIINIRLSKHLNFNGITLKHSVGSAISINDAENIKLNDIEVSNVGGKGIYAWNSTDTIISNCKIHDTGLGGVLLSGGDRPTLTASGNQIQNTHIYDYDINLLTNSPAIELNGVGVTVTNNLVESGNGAGITISGNDHLVEKNEITQVCLQSGDCGAIYLYGRDWTYRGNIIRHNSVHDIFGYQLNAATLNLDKNFIEYVNDGARGIYLDDAASGANIFGNIIYNISLIGIQLGGGRDNRIENNAIKTDKYAVLVDFRGSYFDWTLPRDSLTTMPINDPTWLKKYPALGITMSNDTWPEGNTIQRNVMISTSANRSILQYRMPHESNNIGNNIVWSTNKSVRLDYNILDKGQGVAVKSNATWNEWLSYGLETNSIIADPCFNISTKTITLSCTNSPAYQIGYQPIPAGIGLIN
ncbi:right-handed parallel beta-helix repeat-containing protein [Methylomonas sp. OY6]|uniref:Right-handed parallel beta-helix repeat-containing protein n=1 Tax=Methylomonas defluvii TaxID=3045149 RepID=A0ABU4UCF9_9GAMM|nr:right-handed parallel beta-helix repeat-containing protein [Methylomonas sp. OY6]MDX8127156.1 right-handed parallel beta-helix repeat-containing protein [Methylomonas sp. OY6]